MIERIVIQLCTLLTLVSWCTHLSAQTVTNQGMLIYVSPKAVMICNGTFNVNSSGMVIAEDQSQLIVDGTMNVSNGSLSLNASATALITRDLVIGGNCSRVTGTVVRNGSGLLTVLGFVNNKGLIMNYSQIRIHKDLQNEGEVRNQRGALIDISP